MKTVSVLEAEGMVLCHDITRIIPGEFKGRAFKKGHIISREDIPELLAIGKDNIFVWEMDDGKLHENDAALRLAKAAAGGGVSIKEPCEGKVDLVAAFDGLLKVDSELLSKINEIDEIVVATLHSNQYVTAGKAVAGTRIIPLVTDREKIEEIERICSDGHPLLEVKPFTQMKFGIVTTGNEVYHNRIKDGFGPVVRSKLAKFGSIVIRQILVPDSTDKIVEAIGTLIKEGADAITVTGGMSVDPDDLTPAAIRKVSNCSVTYGVPTLPGSMFMLAYCGEVPVMGLPGCVMFERTSIFDLVLPRLLTGERITKMELVKLGYGGLCNKCEKCIYPDCSFGKC